MTFSTKDRSLVENGHDLRLLSIAAIGQEIPMFSHSRKQLEEHCKKSGDNLCLLLRRWLAYLAASVMKKVLAT
jgi:hypothetical protein